MTERLTTMIEKLTGRRVVNYQSQVMFGPDLVVEMFVFDSPSEPHDRAATAEGQLEDASKGEATDEDALDEPAGSGQ